MPKTVYNKLVRDRIPEIIRADGKEAYFHSIEKRPEYLSALSAKIIEESLEVRSAIATEDVMEIAKEIADVLEVLSAVADEFDISMEEIARVQTERREKRGWFAERIFLEFTQ